MRQAKPRGDDPVPRWRLLPDIHLLLGLEPSMPAMTSSVERRVRHRVARSGADSGGDDLAVDVLVRLGFWALGWSASAADVGAVLAASVFTLAGLVDATGIIAMPFLARRHTECRLRASNVSMSTQQKG